MPTILDATGLQIATLQEKITQLTDAYKEIYGSDINVDSNTPDGQLINIFALEIIDLLGKLLEVYNSFDPDSASGIVLDERVAINNISRQGATFSLQQIDVTVDRNLTLAGLDAEANNPDGQGYTVADNQGNQFVLLDSTPVTPGTSLLTFRAKNLGMVTTLPNTINVPVTIVLGVTGINNPSGVLELGKNEEPDAALKIRREKSTAISGIGNVDSMRATLLDLEGVTDAKVYENRANVTDSRGIPPHSTWSIVEGGANSDIFDALFVKKSFGSGFKGDVLQERITDSGEIFDIRFDRPISKLLYVRFDLKAILGATYDLPAIKQYIVDNMVFEISDNAEGANLSRHALDAINLQNSGKGFPLDVEVSKNGTTYFDFLAVDTLDEKWILDVSRISVTLI